MSAVVCPAAFAAAAAGAVACLVINCLAHIFQCIQLQLATHYLELDGDPYSHSLDFLR